MIDKTAPRPITILVSAIGGEGGGVLASWIVAAARRAGYPVQSTSIPGVAQRTGATTYYLEIFPVPIDELDGREPVMGVYPGIGDIDIMVASEFAEAGRAIANGFVTPDRTLLIASTHRVYAINERGAMGDGRFDSERLADAAASRARMTRLMDFRGLAESRGVSLNAILFGVLAAQGGLPMDAADYKIAIDETAVAVRANLSGFDIGRALAFDGANSTPLPPSGTPSVAGTPAGRLATEFPEIAHDVLAEGVKRLTAYQDPLYAGLYLDRLIPIRDAEQAGGGDGVLVREVGRHLALRMSYEDVIRVAQLKASPGRLDRIRAEVRAGADEPVVVIDFFKPGIEEFCSILPPRLAEPAMNFARRRGWMDRAYLGMRINATSIFGYLRLRALASLRPFRRGTWRFSIEQGLIDAWLDDVARAAALSLSFATEVAATAALIKGYGDTFRRGLGNFNRIRARVIEPALAGTLPMTLAVDALSNARAAALADPEGTRLDTVLDRIGGDIADAAE